MEPANRQLGSHLVFRFQSAPGSPLAGDRIGPSGPQMCLISVHTLAAGMREDASWSETAGLSSAHGRLYVSAPDQLVVPQKQRPAAGGTPMGGRDTFFTFWFLHDSTTAPRAPHERRPTASRVRRQRCGNHCHPSSARPGGALGHRERNLPSSCASATCVSVAPGAYLRPTFAKRPCIFDVSGYSSVTQVLLLREFCCTAVSCVGFHLGIGLWSKGRETLALY